MVNIRKGLGSIHHHLKILILIPSLLVSLFLTGSATAFASTTTNVIQAPALPGAQPISPADRIYTTDQVSNTVTVINPATNQVLGTISLGNIRLDGLFTPVYNREINTHGIGFSPDGSMIDVINVTSNAADVIRTVDNTVIQTTYVGRAPHEGFISPSGKELWVAVRGLDYVSVISMKTGQEVDRIHTAQGPAMIVFSPDGKQAWVNHSRANELDVIDVSTHEVIQRITGLVSPFSPKLMISPDGKEVWLTHKDVGKVTVVDAKTFQILTVLTTGPVTNHVNFVSKPNANYAYVTVGGNNETLVFRRNGANPQLVKSIPNSGHTPHGLWPSPDNTRMYVALEDSDALDVIDTDALQVIATLKIGQQPQTLVYVANAVPQGSGTQNLTSQGLGMQVANLQVTVNNSSGTGEATIRHLGLLDMIEVRGNGLQANSTYTVYFSNGTITIPVVDFQTDSQGAGNSLAFTTFFSTFNQVVIAPK